MDGIPVRTESWLTQEVFNIYQSETDMMRYIHQLCSKDYSLVTGMMPLGKLHYEIKCSSRIDACIMGRI